MAEKLGGPWLEYTEAEEHRTAPAGFLLLSFETHPSPPPVTIPRQPSESIAFMSISPPLWLLLTHILLVTLILSRNRLSFSFLAYESMSRDFPWYPFLCHPSVH